MDILFLLNSSAILAMKYKYFLVFLGMIIEGPIIMIVCGFLYRLGGFELLPLFLALLFGDLVADVMWYYVGYFFAKPFLRKFGRFFGFKEEHVEKVHQLYNKFHSRILLLSKLTIGFGFAILVIIFAGMTKVSMKTFLWLNAIGEAFVVTFLLIVGFFLGHLYESIDKGYKVAGLVVICIIVLAMFYGFSRYTKERLLFKKI